MRMITKTPTEREARILLRKPNLIRKCVLATFAGVLLFVCASCEDSPPKRSFSTLDLLMDVSAMPSGWQEDVRRRLEEGDDYFTTDDSAWVAFIAEGENTFLATQQSVYRYPSSSKARSIYEDSVLLEHVGNLPAEWTYQSLIADESDIDCYDYEGRVEYPICTWTARYEEYVVIVRSWLITDRISLCDLERIAEAVDLKMADYLDINVQK